MSFNTTTVMQMTDGWVVPQRRTIDSLSAGSSSSASSPHSSLQHIPAYNYYDSASQQNYLHYQPSRGITGSNRRSSATDAMDVAERNYYHRMMERAAYINRSFMHHNGFEQQLKQQHRGRDLRGDSMLDSSHYVIDYVDRRNDRRRHSMHHIAQPTVSKMEDLKQRFDEYSSSAAVGRGHKGGGGVSGGGSKRPSRQNNGIPFAIGGPVDGGRLNFGYSGSKTLDVYESQQRAVPIENRQKGSSAKTPKRGSRSSQGSTDSSHSSHSASSGSLLLTVANLENFAKIHKKHESSYGTSRTMEEYLSSTVGVVPTAAIMEAVGSKYNSNIILTHNHDEDVHLADQAGEHGGNQPTSSAIISIEEDVYNHHQQQQHQLQQDQQQQTKPTKTKDPDSVSVASSTHFTMINGVGGPQRLPKSGICSRGHQITILIVTMSIVFMIGICAAVFFLEMRAREMPR